MKKLIAASHKAKQDTARVMTRQLRQHAISEGWDADVVNHLDVIHEDGKFKTKIHPDYADRAFVHEFGNENVRPTAAIRKFSNDPTNAGKAFMVSLNYHWRKAS